MKFIIITIMFICSMAYATKVFDDGVKINGALQIVDGTEGVSGECFVTTDTAGNGNWDTCPGGGGEINTASNVGAGDGVFKTKNVFDLEHKTLIGGTNISITNNTDDLTIVNDISSTTDLSEGTNLYYTEVRVSANTDVTSNTGHVAGDGSDHADVASNTSALTGKADTDLNNLAATSVNLDLDPASGLTDMGSQAIPWGDIISKTSQSGILTGGLGQQNTNNTSTDFDGVDEEAVVAPDSNLGSGISTLLTLVAWVRSDAVLSQRQVVGHWDAGASQKKYIMITGTGGDSDHLRIIMSNNGTTDTKDFRCNNLVTFGDDVWHMIAITYSGPSSTVNELKVYQDGTENTGCTKTTDNATDSLHNSTDEFAIGMLDGGSFYDGKVDKVAVYNAELTAAQISELYNSGEPGDYRSASTHANLVSLWEMGDGDTNPTIFDKVGANNLTQSNMEAGDFVTDSPGTVGILIETKAGHDLVLKTDSGIVLRDSSVGTINDLWTSSGTNGEGGWVTPSFANDTLSNLGTTSINASLLFDTTRAYDLGSSNEEVDDLFVDNIRGGTGGNAGPKLFSPILNGTVIDVEMAGAAEFRPATTGVGNLGGSGNRWNDYRGDQWGVFNGTTRTLESDAGSLTGPQGQSVGSYIRSASAVSTEQVRSWGMFTQDCDVAGQSCGNQFYGTGDNANATGDGGIHQFRAGLGGASGEDGYFEFVGDNGAFRRRTTNSEMFERIIFGQVITTDATVTTIAEFTYATASDGFAIKAECIGKVDAAGTTNVYDLFAGGEDDAGTPAIVGSVDQSAKEDDADWDCTIDTNGSDSFRVRVTGEAATTIEWGVRMRVVHLAN